MNINHAIVKKTKNGTVAQILPCITFDVTEETFKKIKAHNTIPDNRLPAYADALLPDGSIQKVNVSNLTAIKE